LTFVGLLGGVISLALVARQLRASNRQTKLTAGIATRQFLLDVINRYLDDPEMARLNQLIDSDSFVYNPDTAPAVSRTLNYFDTLAFLVNKKLTSLEDVAILKKQIDAFFRNREVRQVLTSSYAWYSPGSETSHEHGLAEGLYRQLQGIV